jgi:hypothetical protein
MANGDSIPYSVPARYLYFLPNRFLDPMAASKVGPLVLQSMRNLSDDGCLITNGILYTCGLSESSSLLSSPCHGVACAARPSKAPSQYKSCSHPCPSPQDHPQASMIRAKPKD